jgi:hypothetical protein
MWRLYILIHPCFKNHWLASLQGLFLAPAVGRPEFAFPLETLMKPDMSHANVGFRPRFPCVFTKR